MLEAQRRGLTRMRPFGSLLLLVLVLASLLGELPKGGVFVRAPARDLLIKTVKGKPKTKFITTATSVWIQFDRSLYRWDSQSLEAPEEVKPFVGPATRLKGFNSGDYWFDFGEGLYFARLFHQSTFGFHDEAEIGRIRQVSEGLWLLDHSGADHLVRWDGVEGKGMESLFRGRVLSVGKVLWLGFDKDLYRMVPGVDSKPAPIDEDVGRVNHLYAAGTELWIATDKGLFHWKDGPEVAPRRVKYDFGSVFRVHSAGGYLWIHAKTGLFRQRLAPADSVEIVREATNDNEHVTFRETETAFWIRHRSEWFRFDKRRMSLTEFNLSTLAPIPRDKTPPEHKVDNSNRHIIRTKNGVLWTHAHGQLIRWEDHPAGKPVVVGPLPRPESTFFPNREIVYAEAGNHLLIATTEGLFRCDSNGVSEPVRIRLDTGGITDFHSDGLSLWIAAEKGLFRIGRFKGPWRPNVKLTRIPFSTLYPEHYISLSWKIEDPDWSTIPELLSTRVLVFKASGQEIWPARWDSVQKQYVLQTDEHRLPAGDYAYAIEAVNLMGQGYISPRQEFKVQLGPEDEIKALLSRFAVGAALTYAIVNVLTFVVLVVCVGSGSRVAFALLIHPLTRAIGVYYGVVIRRVAWVRAWILQPYIRSLEDAFPPGPSYLPRPLIRPAGSRLSTIDVLDELLVQHRVWIQGGPGTGKTEMTRDLVRRFAEVQHPGDEAVPRPFVPILIRMREAGGRSALECIRDVLTEYGLPFAADEFLAEFVASGPFLLLLDGMNEGRLDRDDVEGWLRGLSTALGPNTRLLVTSQANPVKEGVPVYRLPPFTADEARMLLKKFLADATIPSAGKQRERSAAGPGTEFLADATIPSAADLLLASEGMNAYDVRLIADLSIAQRPLPNDRYDLFNATLQLASDYALPGTPFPEEAVCRIAWDKWLRWNFSLFSGDGLPDDVLVSLNRAQVIVVSGTHYEFRHELMQAYLAARYATRHATSPLACLRDSTIWQLSATRQDRVLKVLTDLITRPEELEALGDYALGDEQRGRLQAAVLGTARRREWPLDLVIDGSEGWRYVEALRYVTLGELNQIILGLGMRPADVPYPEDQIRRATEFVRRLRRQKRLPELRQLILRLYPDADLA